MTDETILALAARPETRDEAFRGLVETYQRRLYAVIRRQVREHSDADDILQETFLKVFRHIGSFEGRSGLYTWMYRIVGNEVANHWNRNQRHKSSGPAEDIPDGAADAWVDPDGIARQLEEAVGELPPQQQRVFRMRYYEELPYRQIAGMLNLTEGALKASFHHAVRKIEASLKAKQIR